MSDHDDLLAEVRRLRLWRDAAESDMENLRDGKADALAEVRRLRAERDALAAQVALDDEGHRRVCDPIAAELAALRSVVRRFGPPPGALLLPQDQADALRNALETTDE